jgi:hypothetical protein
MAEGIRMPPDEDQLEDLVYNITVSDGMVPGSKWTRRQLKRLACWAAWLAADKEQLDGMALAKMFGKPEPRPTGAIVLRSVWQYSVKHDGRKKARTCCDGSFLRSKILKYAEQCYAACISQTGMKIFFVFVVIRGWVIISGDVVNAYAQTAMPEGEFQYMAIDQQMIDWWFEKHGTRLTLDMVSRINMALQGHPRAGQWWADKILQHLKDIGFRPLRHKACLYIGKFENLEVLVCRQTDDFMFGGESEPSLRRLANKIGKEVDFLVTYGLITHYNGLEVVQDRDYGHIHVGPYIDKILNNHGWGTSGKDEDQIIEPVHTSSIKEIE